MAGLINSFWGASGVSYLLDDYANGFIGFSLRKLKSSYSCGRLTHIDELRYVVDCWRMDYNHYRPHSSLRFMAPAGIRGEVS